MKPAELRSRRVLVVGCGVTGASVIRYLHHHEVAFDVADEQGGPGAALYSELGMASVFDVFEAARFVSYDVLVLSPGIPRSHPAVAAAIAAGRQVIGDVELFAAVVRKPVIAVTGSNGKSTVVAWLAHALEYSGVRALACGNIGEPVLDCLGARVDVFIVELSSFQLESTGSLVPLVATVLNLSVDHMDRYASIDAYAAAKRNIYVGAQHRVANRDDPLTWPNPAREARFFALATAQAQDWRCQEHEGQMWLYEGACRRVRRVDLPLPGTHNVANALAVLALAAPLVKSLGQSTDLDSDALMAGLLDFSGLPHRTELVAEIDGVRWYNDSKGTNVDACSKAIEAMDRPVLLIAGGQGKGADFTRLAPVVARRVRLAVLIGQDRHRLAAALQPVTRVELADTLAQAVALCHAQASPGDAVLLSPACASFDQFDNYQHRGDVFRTQVEARAA